MEHNRTLYSCRTDELAPDFTKFRAFEVAPYRFTADGCYERVSDKPYLADGWTVYGISRSQGYPVAITDVPTRKLALEIAKLFSVRTGLAVVPVLQRSAATLAAVAREKFVRDVAAHPTSRELRDPRENAESLHALLDIIITEARKLVAP